MSSEFVGFIVGLSESQAAFVTQRFVHCSVTSVTSSDFESVFLRDDLDRPGCIAAALPQSPVEVRRIVRQLSEKRSPLMVIWLTEHADVPSVVEAIRSGAVDVLPWPVSETTLESTIAKACRTSYEQRSRLAVTAEAQQKLARLSARERDVLDLILAGKVNKYVASRLGIALRTVENRRKQIFTKLGTRSLAEIVQLVQDAKVDSPEDESERAVNPPSLRESPWDRAAG